MLVTTYQFSVWSKLLLLNALSCRVRVHAALKPFCTRMFQLYSAVYWCSDNTEYHLVETAVMSVRRWPFVCCVSAGYNVQQWVARTDQSRLRVGRVWPVKWYGHQTEVNVDQVVHVHCWRCTRGDLFTTPSLNCLIIITIH